MKIAASLQDRILASFFAIAGVGLLACAYQWFTLRTNTGWVGAGLCALVLGGIGWAWRGGPDRKKRAAALLCSSLVSAWLLEALIAAVPGASGDVAERRAAAAKRLGVPFDARGKVQILQDLRATGARWYPAIGPHQFMADNLLPIAGTKVLPLGGIGGAAVVDCNENGYYSTTTTDELGFVNPRGIWSTPGPLDAALVGDSFTRGCCVRDTETIAAHLRQHLPRTVSLGSLGNGPLVQLATITEYFQTRDVKWVFWLYYEANDLTDLETREVNQPVLQNYLADPQYTQKLEWHQPAVDAALRAFVEQNLAHALALAHPMRDCIFDHATLANVRRALASLKGVVLPPPPRQYSLTRFGQILGAAKARVAARGGQLVFVYLPEYGRYIGQRLDEESSAHRKPEVLALARDLGLAVIDVDPAFAAVADPATLFPFGLFGHYNAAGYRLVADQILRFLGKGG